jgi:hypothetical protein
MADLIYISVIVAFFAAVALFVVACDYLIGPDEALPDIVAEPEQVAA